MQVLGKAASQRFAAAFAKLSVCLLVELGAHNPLACAIGAGGEKEYARARRLLAQLPAGCLLLADWSSPDKMDRPSAAAWMLV